MRIKKVSQTTSTQAQVVDGYSTSTTDSYSANYVNGLAGKVIYENSQGTDLNLVCTDVISDFDYLQFDYEHQSSHATVLAPIIDNKIQIRSIGIPGNNNTMQIMIQKYTINNKTLELDVEGMVNISNNTISYQSFTFGTQATIRVKKIIGIKR